MERQIAVQLSHEEAIQDTQQIEMGAEPAQEHRIILALLKLHSEIITGACGGLSGRFMP